MRFSLRLASILLDMLQGPTQKRGRPTTNKATQAAAGDSGSLATSACVEKRAPVLSVSCLCRLLTAITENGLIPEAEAQVSLFKPQTSETHVSVS